MPRIILKFLLIILKRLLQENMIIYIGQAKVVSLFCYVTEIFSNFSLLSGWVRTVIFTESGIDVPCSNSSWYCCIFLDANTLRKVWNCQPNFVSANLIPSSVNSRISRVSVEVSVSFSKHTGLHCMFWLFLIFSHHIW